MNCNEYNKLTDVEKDKYLDELLALSFERADRELIKEIESLPDPPEIKGGFKAIMKEFEKRENVV